MSKVFCSECNLYRAHVTDEFHRLEGDSIVCDFADVGVDEVDEVDPEFVEAYVAGNLPVGETVTEQMIKAIDTVAYAAGFKSFADAFVKANFGPQAILQTIANQHKAFNIADLDDPDALEAYLAKLASDETKATEALSPLQKIEEALAQEQAAALAEYETKVAKVRAEQAKIQKQHNFAASLKAKIQSERDAAEAKLITLRKAQEAEANYLAYEQRINLLTAGAPWREFAKDHQIEGAKRMTLNKRFILADKMGTGKTCTAIIALDMLAAETADGYVRWDELEGYHNCELIATGKDTYGNDYTGETGTATASYGECECVSKVVKDDDVPTWKQPTKYGKYRYAFSLPPVGKRVLWFAPANVINAGGPEREFARWAPKRNVLKLTGTTRVEREMAIRLLKRFHEADENYIVLVNYEIGRRHKDFVQALSEPGLFDSIVIDEAHMIKNLKSTGFRDIKTILNGSGISNIFPMTGTPILNRPQELFTILNLVAPEQFANINAFLRSYCIQDYSTGTPRWVFRPGGAESLLKRMGHLYLARTKKEAGFLLDEPEIKVYNLTLDEDFNPEQFRVYQEMRDKAMIDLDPENKLRATHALSWRMRLRQLVTWPAGITVKDAEGNFLKHVDVHDSVKIDAVIKAPATADEEWEGLIPEVVDSEKVVLVSQFNDPLEEIARRCKAAGIKAGVLRGDLSWDARKKLLDAFTETEVHDGNGGIDVLLMNYKVGGIGIDGLQKVASQMIVLDEEWNPGKRDQAYDRLNRFGQTQQVTVHLLRVEKSIDDWMAMLMEQKENLLAGFNEAADNLADAMYDALKNGLI